MSKTTRRWVPFLFLFLFPALLSGCAPLEKRVDLNYRQAVYGSGGSGEIFLARPVFEKQPAQLPGGRVILGPVRGTDTLIVTTDDLSQWIADALIQELSSVGYEVRRVPALSARVSRGVVLKVQNFSCNQLAGELVLTTSTHIALVADVWENGRVVKTLTASAGSEDQGLDRSGPVVAASLEKTLQSTLRELVPGIIGSFR
ncbi:MAG: hypothetical protein ABSC19_17180 [Syntrophorhabdales bacterium]|jgi:hypothetical protein